MAGPGELYILPGHAAFCPVLVLDPVNFCCQWPNRIVDIQVLYSFNTFFVDDFPLGYSSVFWGAAALPALAMGVGIPVVFVDDLLQCQLATGAVDDDPDVDGVFVFLGGAEYEMQAERVAASHLAMI